MERGRKRRKGGGGRRRRKEEEQGGGEREEGMRRKKRKMFFAREWQEADGAATKLTEVTRKQHCTWHARESAVHFNLHKPRQRTKSSQVILCKYAFLTKTR